MQLILSKHLLLVSIDSFNLVLEYQGQYDADHADDQAAQKSRPETVHQKADMEIRAYHTRQPEEESIDYQCEQPQGEDVEQAGQKVEQRAQKRIQQAKNQR